MTPAHSAEATAGAAGLLAVFLAWVGKILTALFVVPPITWGTYVTAACLGAAGGWLIRNIAPGISDEADKTVAIVMAAGCGGFFGPLISVIANHHWTFLEALPMDGVIPFSVGCGMLLPFILGVVIRVIDDWKKNPAGFFAALAKLRSALKGGK